MIGQAAVNEYISFFLVTRHVTASQAYQVNGGKSFLQGLQGMVNMGGRAF
jgi:hypothetical protein